MDMNRALLPETTSTVDGWPNGQVASSETPSVRDPDSRCRSLKVTGLLLPLFCFLWPTAVAAQEGADETNYAPPVERRSGFSIGLGAGLGVGSFTGYPNEVEKIDNSEYRSSTGLAPASGYSIWLGGALRDWLTVAVGLFTSGGGNEETVGAAGAFGMHIEAFPLYGLGGAFRDLGLVSEFGAGGGALQDGDGEETANGGNMSFVGIGAFFEPWQFWQMSHGPMLMYKTQFSDTMNGNAVFGGWRLAFYWTQPD